MSNTVIECLLCFDTLKTIGIFLLQEGLYQIRANMYVEAKNGNKNAKIIIPPIECLQLKKKDVQYLQAHIIQNFYMTDTFLLRQWTEEEKFEIQNACRFQAAIPSEFMLFPVFLEIELMFYDLQNKIVTFQSISMAKFKIEQARSGVYEYVPVIVGDDHFSLINTSIFYSIIDIQVAKSNKVVKSKSSEDIQELMKVQFSKFIDPLKLALRGMLEFYRRMELDIERPSSSGGISFIRQSKSYSGVINSTGSEKLFKQENNLNNLTKLMANEYKNVKQQLQMIWSKIQIGIKLQHPKIIKQLKKDSLVNFQSRFSAFTKKESIPVVDHSYTTVLQDQRQSQQQQEIENKRGQYQKLIQGPSKVVDTKILEEIKDKLVIFERHYYTRVNQPIQRNKMHLIVFVHGYQGHSYDMRMLENYMCLRFPQHMLLVSLSNQHNTEGDITQMGKNLSEEVKNYINTWSFTTKITISFVAHSLGGLIVRAALPELEYDFHTLMTLGTPHLGYITNNHTLINFGMWVLQKVKKSLCLSQLNCKDDTLLRLSNLSGMHKFKHIILFGSQQDHYVTGESCLILKINQDNVHNQMAINLLKQLNQNEILRITVDYKFYDGDFDTFLGRKAHVAILESHFLNQYIIYNLGDYFK